MIIKSPPTPKPRRRWLQFSLRALLVLALGAGLGWLAHDVHQADGPECSAKRWKQSTPGVHKSLDGSG
jgi:hypothetical protein